MAQQPGTGDADNALICRRRAQIDPLAPIRGFLRESPFRGQLPDPCLERVNEAGDPRPWGTAIRFVLARPQQRYEADKDVMHAVVETSKFRNVASSKSNRTNLISPKWYEVGPHAHRRFFRVSRNRLHPSKITSCVVYCLL